MRALVPNPARPVRHHIYSGNEGAKPELSYSFWYWVRSTKYHIYSLHSALRFRLTFAAQIGNEPMRQGIMRALVPTPAKPARYQSWTRAFLPSMVFKKNKKIRPVHKLFCILILMIQMTARNFTKSPEGPYWYCTKKRKKRNKRRQEIRGNITRSNWILRCHLYKEDVNYCFSCIKIKREKTKSAKNDKKTWWERDICCSNAEQGPIWLLKQR